MFSRLLSMIEAFWTSHNDRAEEAQARVAQDAAWAEFRRQQSENDPHRSPLAH